MQHEEEVADLYRDSYWQEMRSSGYSSLQRHFDLLAPSTAGRDNLESVGCLEVTGIDGARKDIADPGNG